MACMVLALFFSQPKKHEDTHGSIDRCIERQKSGIDASVAPTGQSVRGQVQRRQRAELRKFHRNGTWSKIDGGRGHTNRGFVARAHVASSASCLSVIHGTIDT